MLASTGSFSKAGAAARGTGAGNGAPKGLDGNGAGAARRACSSLADNGAGRGFSTGGVTTASVTGGDAGRPVSQPGLAGRGSAAAGGTSAGRPGDNIGADSAGAATPCVLSSRRSASSRSISAAMRRSPGGGDPGGPRRGSTRPDGSVGRAATRAPLEAETAGAPEAGLGSSAIILRIEARISSMLGSTGCCDRCIPTLRTDGSDRS